MHNPRGRKEARTLASAKRGRVASKRKSWLSGILRAARPLYAGLILQCLYRDGSGVRHRVHQPKDQSWTTLEP